MMMKKYILLWILIFLGFNFLFGQQLRSVSAWEELFLQDKKLNYDLDNKLSLSNDSWSFYKIAYSLDAHIAMFQATGKTIYLDRALEIIYNMKNSAVPSFKLPKSQFKDKYLSWANHSNEELGDDGKEYPLYESFCWRYVTSLLKIMNGSESILKDRNYYNQYADILKFTEINIFDKWQSRGEGNIYRSNTHMTSHWARISLDLWLITKKDKYKTVFTNFNESMRNQFEIDDQIGRGYLWGTWWKKTSKIAQIAGMSDQLDVFQIQDVSHGNAIVGYIIDAYDSGIYFNKADINALLINFNTLILKGNKGGAKYIDGSGQGGSGRFVDGFMKLGKYDIRTQIRLESYDFGPSSVYNRRNQFFAYGCLNAKVLISGKTVFPD